jgi:NADH-quinone oxidoreductase subunit E
MTHEILISEIENVIDHATMIHGTTADALIPILNEINNKFGYIPQKSFSIIRSKIKMPENKYTVSESQLYGLASFYHMFSVKPLGKHIIRFCESAPCHVMGGRQLIQSLKDLLQLEPGETSSDGMWSLITTSCLGVCGVGPVILIDNDIYGNLQPEQLPEILAIYDPTFKEATI